jgi:hypothetical protein
LRQRWQQFAEADADLPPPDQAAAAFVITHRAEPLKLLLMRMTRQEGTRT